MLAGICLIMATVSAMVSPPQVTGVVESDGKPLAGALVLVTSVRAANDSYVWAERHRDLGLRTRTDEQGNFTLPVSGTAWRLTVTCFHPAAAAANAELLGSGPAAAPISLPPTPTPNGDKSLRVRVADAAGAPIAGALVLPSQVYHGSTYSSWGGTLLESAAWTDPQGNAALVVPEAIDRQVAGRTATALGVIVFAPAMAPTFSGPIEPGELVTELKAASGCRVVGRLLGPDGPVPGAWLDLLPAEARGDPCVVRERARTDEDGAFAFEHITADAKWMVSCPSWENEPGVTIVPIEITTPPDGETLDIGAFHATHGLKIGGRLTADLGVSVPPGAWVVLTNEKGWLSWAMPVGDKAAFAFTGVPAGGPYRLLVIAPGRKLSSRNAAQSRNWPTSLHGVVTRDHTDLEVLLVSESAPEEKLQPRDEPMRGVEEARAH